MQSDGSLWEMGSDEAHMLRRESNLIYEERMGNTYYSYLVERMGQDSAQKRAKICKKAGANAIC